MPAYNVFANPSAAYPGDSVTVINAEQPAAGVASQQVALGDKDGQVEKGISVEVSFPAAPGAFEVDLQLSDTDLDKNYVTSTLAITAADINASNVARKELSTFAKFGRLLTKTPNANAVNCTAKISLT